MKIVTGLAFFWVNELDQDRLNDLLVAKPGDIEELRLLVSDWWEFSPFEAAR